jgi:hypothetical protein
MPKSGCRDLNPGPLDPQVSEAERGGVGRMTWSTGTGPREVKNSSELPPTRPQSPPYEAMAHGPPLLRHRPEMLLTVWSGCLGRVAGLRRLPSSVGAKGRHSWIFVPRSRSRAQYDPAVTTSEVTRRAMLDELELSQFRGKRSVDRLASSQ